MMGYVRLPGSTPTMPDFTPLYRLIMADIRTRIASGEFPAGFELPSTAALLAYYRERLNVQSASTVRQAITLLIETGELRGHQGKGVYVAG